MFDILKVGKNYPQKESGSCILVMILLVFPPQASHSTHTAALKGHGDSQSARPLPSLFSESADCTEAGPDIRLSDSSQ